MFTGVCLIPGTCESWGKAGTGSIKRLTAASERVKAPKASFRFLSLVGHSGSVGFLRILGPPSLIPWSVVFLYSWIAGLDKGSVGGCVVPPPLGGAVAVEEVEEEGGRPVSSVGGGGRIEEGGAAMLLCLNYPVTSREHCKLIF